MLPENQFQTPELPKPKGKNTLVLVVVLIAVLVIAATAAAYFVVGGKGEREVVTEPKITTEGMAVDTSGWQTYRNEKYGFEFKYPFVVNGVEGRWIFVPSDHGEEVNGGLGPISSKPGGYIWGFTMYDNNNFNLEESINRTGDQFADRKETRENILIGGAPALLVTVTTNEVEGWINKHIYLERDGKTFIMSNGSVDRPEFEAYYKSLRFFAPTQTLDTSNWQTYRNEEYGFEFKYPSSWVIKKEEKRIPRDYGPYISILDLEIADESSGELRLRAWLLPSEWANQGASQGAFTDSYNRIEYFHGGKIDERYIDGFKTVIHNLGCYECYGESKEFIEKVSKQPISLTCNTSGVCLQIRLVESGGSSTDLKDFFLSKFVPSLNFDREIFNSIEYEFQKSPG